MKEEFEKDENRFPETITHCRKCNAPIQFVKTLKNNKWMPVDTNPCRMTSPEFKSNNIYLLETGKAIKGYNADSDDWLYTSHFATCPQANYFRKKEK